MIVCDKSCALSKPTSCLICITCHKTDPANYNYKSYYSMALSDAPWGSLTLSGALSVALKFVMHLYTILKY